VRRREVLVGVPEIVAVAAADLDHVAEALRRHHRRRRQLARDQRVGGDRRAVREEDDVLERDACLADALEHALDRVGGAGDLGDAQRVAGLVEDADVGEGSADVDCDAK
jgi:hypothetical protein